MGNGMAAKFLAEHSDELRDGGLKVCVGGGAGFIGSHIAKRLKEEVITYQFDERKIILFFFMN
jgi:hypothetical protein